MRLPAAAFGGIVIGLLMATGCGGTSEGTGRGAPAGAGTASDRAAVDRFRSITAPKAAAEPSRVVIPAIGVDAPVEKLGLLPSGEVDVPRRWGDVGWFSGGSRPGEPGPTVLLGHVDSRSGPAVFYRLTQLRRGDVVDVRLVGGTVVRYVVSGSGRYAKSKFPTDEVYLPTLRPELRLVTCGGAFDRTVGHYVDNVVVYAARAP